MKFLCIPCDVKMEVQVEGGRGLLSECSLCEGVP